MSLISSNILPPIFTVLDQYLGLIHSSSKERKKKTFDPLGRCPTSLEKRVGSNQLVRNSCFGGPGFNIFVFAKKVLMKNIILT